ncbi:hypothetical protein UFOVP119_12 [uncultured Caudovirales phage]|uniref:Uncharacterized protein n=1 Tax=uncultured Caudovirales phage TaxID=2100421 RepID=A0A6J5L6Z6_9CAUD|nr:hypothetical protein UFOVP119_12 [uncultured Caudovirales phage]
MSQRRIVCAAIRHPDGRIVCGPRHLDDTMWATIHSMSPQQWKAHKAAGREPSDEAVEWGWKSEQGFVDQRGEFVDRIDAWAIAVMADQIVRSDGMPKGRLFSEHLY